MLFTHISRMDGRRNVYNGSFCLVSNVDSCEIPFPKPLKFSNKSAICTYFVNGLAWKCVQLFILFGIKRRFMQDSFSQTPKIFKKKLPFAQIS